MKDELARIADALERIAAALERNDVRIDLDQTIRVPAQWDPALQPGDGDPQTTVYPTPNGDDLRTYITCGGSGERRIGGKAPIH